MAGYGPIFVFEPGFFGFPGPRLGGVRFPFPAPVSCLETWCLQREPWGRPWPGYDPRTQLDELDLTARAITAWREVGASNPRRAPTGTRVMKTGPGSVADSALESDGQ